MQEARRRGVPPHRVVAWVRRKLGGGLLVVRFRTDGSVACAAPCILCSREIERFDLKVVCVDESGAWFSGRLSDPGAPPQRLTTGQKNAQFGKWQVARTWPSRRAAAAPSGDGDTGSGQEQPPPLPPSLQRVERERGGGSGGGGGSTEHGSTGDGSSVGSKERGSSKGSGEHVRGAGPTAQLPRTPSPPPQLPLPLRERRPVPLLAR